MEKTKIKFTLNNEEVELMAAPSELLVDVLRDHFLLTGTKIGCRQGDCGACSVILNGNAVNSCLVPIMKVQGQVVQTVEGIGEKNTCHPIQEAFMDNGAVQCGFCTPGMIISAKALLDKNSSPKKEEIKEAISGNICRCTGYLMIVEAVNRAAEMIRASEKREGRA
ncbi:(2Fe-2S)-binding protein [Dethiosulfatarculus sandiegensis]|uniref:(2Fe-2S)-binding protein n=1 Tax=Dethiosulfatarculus sandiegensis TaxID=1429043 RepID=A0A0D2HUY0_9BACT|nr:(2Fe-2S)-binding protein [Dethiosulfatarculus sandiegensis]KIX14228.1 (2Fe-2S)-binding protein [Dethiosulfatarculus sandiegensis]